MTFLQVHENNIGNGRKGVEIKTQKENLPSFDLEREACVKVVERFDVRLLL